MTRYISGKKATSPINNRLSKGCIFPILSPFCKLETSNSIRSGVLRAFRDPPNEQTGRMEAVRSYKYNNALNYLILERCGIKTRGKETYHLCNQHEIENIKKKLCIKRKSGRMIETDEFEIPKSIGLKWKENYTSKRVGICREISSMEKRLWET